MKKGQIVTLDDNSKYLLLMDTNQEGHKFFYANKLTEDEKTTGEYEIFEEAVEDGETFMDLVLDEDIKGYLMNIFTTDLLETALDIEKGNIDLEDDE